MDLLKDKDLRARFKIICLRCGSENVVLDYEPEHRYSELTLDPAWITIGCNDCKNNDKVIV